MAGATVGGGHTPISRREMHQGRADAAMVPGGGQMVVGGLSRGNGGDVGSSLPFDFGAPR